MWRISISLECRKVRSTGSFQLYLNVMWMKPSGCGSPLIRKYRVNKWGVFMTILKLWVSQAGTSTVEIFVFSKELTNKQLTTDVFCTWVCQVCQYSHLIDMCVLSQTVMCVLCVHRKCGCWVVSVSSKKTCDESATKRLSSPSGRWRRRRARTKRSVRGRLTTGDTTLTPSSNVYPLKGLFSPNLNYIFFLLRVVLFIHQIVLVRITVFWDKCFYLTTPAKSITAQKQACIYSSTKNRIFSSSHTENISVAQENHFGCAYCSLVFCKSQLHNCLFSFAKCFKSFNEH